VQSWGRRWEHLDLSRDSLEKIEYRKVKCGKQRIEFAAWFRTTHRHQRQPLWSSWTQLEEVFKIYQSLTLARQATASLRRYSLPPSTLSSRVGSLSLRLATRQHISTPAVSISLHLTCMSVLTSSRVLLYYSSLSSSFLASSPSPPSRHVCHLCLDLCLSWEVCSMWERNLDEVFSLFESRLGLDVFLLDWTSEAGEYSLYSMHL